MGAARSTYTPDVVMLLSQPKPKALSNLWAKNGLPNVKIDEQIECADGERQGLSIKKLLEKHGITICKLEVPKARDGMQKFTTLLEFHFEKNIFKKVNWEGIKRLLSLSDNFENESKTPLKTRSNSKSDYFKNLGIAGMNDD
jgi:hypothetical protein